MSLRNRLHQASENKPDPPAQPPAPEQTSTSAAAPEPAEPTAAAKPATGGLRPEDYARLRRWLIDKLNNTLADNRSTPSDERMREYFDAIYTQAGVKLSALEVDILFKEVRADIVGYGPIQPLLDDPDISEVMVNGPKQVYIERKGKLTLSDVTFEDNDHVLRIIDRIVRPLGRRIDARSPMVDARLPDGSRVNAIVPPIAIDGASITIRKFGQQLTIKDLIRFGSMTSQIADFLEACVVSRLNVVVSGGTGSGKTTLLNVLSNFIPEDERIVTIEDSAELQLAKPHIVRLEARPPDPNGEGEVSIRELVRNSLRMRPERIVIGENRGGEALDMLQAMNTGHDGSLTTLHANNPRETISRLETLVMMAGMDLPIKVIRQQIAQAVDLIVQQARLTDGSRKITHITEVNGMEGDTVVLTDIFKFDEMEKEIRPTGIRPFFTPRLDAYGFKLPPEIFGASMADMIATRGSRRR